MLGGIKDERLRRNIKNILLEYELGVCGVEGYLATLTDTQAADTSAKEMRRILSTRSPNQVVDLVWLCEELDPTSDTWVRIRRCFPSMFDLEKLQDTAQAAFALTTVDELRRRGVLKVDLDRCFDRHRGFCEGLLALYDLVTSRREAQMRLIPVHERDDSFSEAARNRLIKKNEFFVSAILDKRQKSKKKFYLIKWKGFSPEWNSWEPEDHCESCLDSVKQIDDYIKQDHAAAAAAAADVQLSQASRRASASSRPESQQSRARAHSESRSPAASSSSTTVSPSTTTPPSSRTKRPRLTRSDEIEVDPLPVVATKTRTKTTTKTVRSPSATASSGEYLGTRMEQQYPQHGALVKIWGSAKVGDAVYHLCAFEADSPFLVFLPSAAIWSNAPEKLQHYYESHLQFDAHH